MSSVLQVSSPYRPHEVGLDYFRARHHAPALGRFMQPDPLSIGAAAAYPQTWHPYNYVANNPLVNTDPFGLFCPASGCVAPPAPVPPIAIDVCWFFPGLCSGSARTEQAEATPPPPPPQPSEPVRMPANSKSAADAARCAAQNANHISLAALLPDGTPPIVLNILGNDFSTITNLITGSGTRKCCSEHDGRKSI